MNRATSHHGLSALAGMVLLVVSCRSGGPMATIGVSRPGTVAAFSMESMANGDGRRNGDAEQLAVLRYANRLPRIEFPELRPDCLTQGEDFGAWTVRFDGYGCVTVGGTGSKNALRMGPKTAEKEFMTHAPLVLGPSFGNRMVLHTRLETTAQLRPGKPNPWEVAWVIWHYTNDERFYYFIPKPNGWELGKRDPAYPGGQRFLASGSKELFPVGRAYDVTIMQVDQTVAVYVDGKEIVRYADEEQSYRSGRIGIYAEDASIKVHTVRAL